MAVRYDIVLFGLVNIFRVQNTIGIALWDIMIEFQGWFLLSCRYI